MTVSPPLLVYPVSPSYLQVGREPSPATVATTFATVKAGAFKPATKPSWLKDDTLWGDMNKLHDLGQGPVWGEHEIPESPLYGDTIGHFLFNLFGDYTVTGTPATPNTTTTAVIAAGAATIAVTAGTSFTVGMWIQIDTGLNAEIVQVLSATSTVITLQTTTPTRFSHASAVAVTNTTAPYTHSFAALNPGATTLNAASCQPPTHTLVHHNTPAGSGNFSADQYLYSCLSELTITGKANGWLTWSAKVTSYGQSTPAAAITSQLTQVKGIPAWRSTNTIASSTVNDVAEWTATWMREMDVIPTADGQQSPYFIGRGQMSAKFKLTLSPAIDESAITHMLSNDQPTLAWAIANGLTGANQVSLAVASQLAGYEESTLTAVKQFWGYEVNGEFVASATGAGNSGGTTTSALTLINNIPSY